MLCDDWLWLNRKWVTVIFHCTWSLLMTPVIGTPESECAHYVSTFEPAENTCLRLSSQWVAAMPCCTSNLLIMSPPWPTRKWVTALASLCQAFWWCVSLTLQQVSGCFDLITLQACWLAIPLALQEVIGYCFFLCFKPAHDTCSQSPESEWLLFIAVFPAYWQSLSSAL